MPAKQTLELGHHNFQSEVLDSGKPVLVDFWADWCAPCRRVGPVVEELAQEFAGRASVGKLNVDDHPELASRYGIRSIPALLFFRNGEVVDQLAGVHSHKDLAGRLESALDA